MFQRILLLTQLTDQFTTVALNTHMIFRVTFPVQNSEVTTQLDEKSQGSIRDRERHSQSSSWDIKTSEKLFLDTSLFPGGAHASWRYSWILVTHRVGLLFVNSASAIFISFDVTQMFAETVISSSSGLLVSPIFLHKVHFIDRMHRWRPKSYSFVYVLIRLTSTVCMDKIQKRMLLESEVSDFN